MSSSQYIEYSVLLCIWTLFLYLFILIILSKNKRVVFSNTNYRVNTFVFWLFLLFCTTCFLDGDNFHYTQWVKNANTKGIIDPFSSAEPFYQYISFFINENYFLFRLIVWGGALLLFSATAKRIDINPRLALYLLFMLFLVTFTFSRMTLAVVAYFYGLSFLIKPGARNTILKILLGIVIIIIAREFHRSANVLLALTPLLLIPNVKNKKIKLIMIICSAIVVYFASYVIIQDMGELVQLTGDDSVVDKYNKYAIKDVETLGLGASIYFGFRHIILWGVTIVCYINNQNNKESFVSYNLYKFSFSLLLFALVLRTIPDTLLEFAKRLDDMATIPVTLLLGYSLSHYNLPINKCNLFVRIGVLANLYKIVYYLYLLLLGQGISLRLMQ